MATSKSEEKRLKVQKPAPESEKKFGTLTISLQPGKPVVSFVGEWTTRDFRNILRAMPRAYREYQINRRKQGEGSFVKAEVSNA